MGSALPWLKALAPAGLGGELEEAGGVARTGGSGSRGQVPRSGLE